ncbi:MAG TPA: site-2 protease family protein [Dehalococcoidia bacterium]|nr:site-2 protease family protein [Dehalococcoidia bacterium]
MIFNLDLLEEDPFAFFILFSALGTALLLGIAFHEFSHAFIADSLGDRLPRSRGRVTLNPLAHLDPLGTLLIATVGFGWGKPVPINPNATANPQASLWMTAAAGPISNFIVAALAGIPIRAGLVEWSSPFFTPFTNNWGTAEYAGYYLSTLVLISVILGIFNLIPIAPLDGFKVVQGLLPRDLSIQFSQLERFGPIILIVLIALPFLTGGEVGLLFDIMAPFIETLVNVFTGIDRELY